MLISVLLVARIRRFAASFLPTFEATSYTRRGEIFARERSADDVESRSRFLEADICAIKILYSPSRREIYKKIGTIYQAAD